MPFCRAWLLPMSLLSTPPLSLYIHIPWCVRKCPYCDFNSHARNRALPETEYLRALLADLDSELAFSVGRSVQSVFFGGGTPSLLSGATVGAILDGVNARLTVAGDAEITLEANPGTAESRRFIDFLAAGVNRLSIGVQSFADEQLNRLGRIHDSAQAVAAFDAARAAGFDNINLDLMHGLPGQTTASAIADLDRAIALAPEHLSWYQLTIERNTAFHKEPPTLPDEEELEVIEFAGFDRLAAAGYRRYEISAYARDGAQCVHNSHYWRFGDYIGIGAGAHGKLTDASAGRINRRQKTRAPGDYLADCTGATTRPVDADQLPVEFAMNALRLADGFEPGLFEARTGLPFDDIRPIVDALRARGLLEPEGKIRCSTTGWRYLDTVVQAFL